MKRPEKVGPPHEIRVESGVCGTMRETESQAAPPASAMGGPEAATSGRRRTMPLQQPAPLVLSLPAGAEEAQTRAPVAQLDRASDYGSEGQGFESSRAHQESHDGDGTPRGVLLVSDPLGSRSVAARTRSGFAPSRHNERCRTCRGPAASPSLLRSFGGEGGIRTLDGRFILPYSLSRGAPSAARPPLLALLPGSRSWRRVRDSNPRTGRPVYGFQDRRLRPLGQPSGQPPGCHHAKTSLGEPLRGGEPEYMGQRAAASTRAKRRAQR